MHGGCGATANRYEVENKRCGSECCVLLGPAAHDGLPHQLIIDALQSKQCVDELQMAVEQQAGMEVYSQTVLICSQTRATLRLK